MSWIPSAPVIVFKRPCCLPCAPSGGSESKRWPRSIVTSLIGCCHLLQAARPSPVGVRPPTRRDDRKSARHCLASFRTRANARPASECDGLTTLGNRRTYLLRVQSSEHGGGQPMADLSRNSPTDLRVAVAGLGAIGTKVAEALDLGINGLVLSAVSVQNPEKHRSWLGSVTCKPAVLPIQALSDAAHILIKCAPTNLI